MKLTDTGGKEFEQAPIGNHVARCVKVIDLGTQKNEYEGKVSYPRQVAIAWELPNERMSDGEYEGQPFIVTKIYTASISEKATLRKHLQMWRGKEFTADELRGFDSKNVLGKACMVSVIHSEKGKAKVEGVASVPKGMEVPPQMNKAVYFSLDPAEFSFAVYSNELSKWYQEKIALSPEFQDQRMGVKPTDRPVASLEDLDSDIPF